MSPTSLFLGRVLLSCWCFLATSPAASKQRLLLNCCLATHLLWGKTFLHHFSFLLSSVSISLVVFSNSCLPILLYVFPPYSCYISPPFSYPLLFYSFQVPSLLFSLPHFFFRLSDPRPSFFLFLLTSTPRFLHLFIPLFVPSVIFLSLSFFFFFSCLIHFLLCFLFVSLVIIHSSHHSCSLLSSFPFCLTSPEPSSISSLNTYFVAKVFSVQYFGFLLPLLSLFCLSFFIPLSLISFLQLPLTPSSFLTSEKKGNRSPMMKQVTSLTAQCRLLQPGKPSYHSVASSCWQFGWATNWREQERDC